MLTPATLTEALEARAGGPRSVHYLAGEEQRRSVSVAELFRTALGVLRHFQDFGMRPGDPLVLFTSSNEQFLDGFWAALLGGIVPVPVAVGISDDHRHKLLRIFRQLEGAWVYTEVAQLQRLREFAEGAGCAAEYEALRVRSLTVEKVVTLGAAGEPHEARPGDVAFIQFSSGSTSDPKGVVLTHANVIANIRGIVERARFTEQDVSLSWMPLTHDMGLIGFHLCMLASGIEHTIMDTRLFSRRPLLWLKEASARGATLLSSPNFGYKHLLKVFASRGLDDDVDLANVRLIFNGAEPISVALCERFLQAMAPFGLRRSAMYPVYGLAEASLAVTFPPPRTSPRATTAARSARAGPRTVGCAAATSASSTTASWSSRAARRSSSSRTARTAIRTTSWRSPRAPGPSSWARSPSRARVVARPTRTSCSSSSCTAVRCRISSRSRTRCAAPSRSTPPCR
jgi:acyl-CoA synthetase (AMP-forming)/AMP-acid ligase II